MADEVTCTEWEATQDRQPPEQRPVIVTGNCKCPTDYSIELRPAVPQGINPRMLILERVVTAPEGGEVGEGPTTEVEVHYEHGDAAEFDQVDTGDGKPIDVKVLY